MKSLRDPKRKPTHPGEVLREDVLPELKMTQTEFAKRLGVSRLSVSELLLELAPAPRPPVPTVARVCTSLAV